MDRLEMVAFIVLAVFVVASFPLWLPVCAIGRMVNHRRLERFARPSAGAVWRSIAADELALRLRDRTTETVEVLPYASIARVLWWEHTLYGGGFASGDEDVDLIEIEEINGRARSFFVAPEPPVSNTREALTPLMNSGKLSRRPLAGGHERGSGGFGAVLVMVSAWVWCGAVIGLLVHRAGADWGLSGFAAICGSALVGFALANLMKEYKRRR